MPLIGWLVLAAMLLVLDKMLRLFQYVVDAGGPVSVVWRMLANLLPEYLSLGIPIGLMLGILLAFRKLALSSELDALRGIGMGYGRLLRVPYAYAIPLAIINLGIVGYLEPYTALSLRRAALRLEVGRARRGDQGRRVQPARQASDAAHRPQREQGHAAPRHFRPERGQQGDDRRRDRGARPLPVDRRSRHHPVPARPRAGWSRIRPSSRLRGRLPSTVYDLPISLPVIDQFRRRGGTESDELYLHELWRLGYGGGAPTCKQKIEAQAHFNFRLVEVVMMFMLPLLAVALAVPPKRSSSALGIFLSILIVVAYHKVNQYAEQAAAQRPARSDRCLVGPAGPALGG